MILSHYQSERTTQCVVDWFCNLDLSNKVLIPSISGKKCLILLAEMNRFAEICKMNWTEIKTDRRAENSARRTEHYS